ncbi:tripartite tricarboxylate transporter substrate binding protein [soil metagenome]
MKHMQSWISALVAGAAVIATAVSAQTFPEKPVKIIVPFTAGGLADALARGLGNELTKVWSQSVIVENRPGANTIIAADATAKSPADGYTLLMANDPTLSSNQYFYTKLAYDPVKDFVPVVNIAGTLEVLVVSDAFKGKTVADLVAAAKASPGSMTYGSYGPGSKAHLDAEKFAQITGTKLNHIPYKGVADVMVAAAGSQIQMAFTGVPPALPMIKAGKLRALAIASPTRSKSLPDTPTFAEVGFPGFESKAWFGLVAPAGTPKAIVDKTAADVQKIIVQPEFQERFVTGVGLELINQGPAQYAEFLKKDRAEYAEQAKTVNVKLD